jgi:hypothetical protein
VSTLSRMGNSDREVVGALAEALGDEDEEVRESAAELLGSLPTPAEWAGVYEKKSRAMAFLFSGLVIPFALFHLLLFAFFPKVKSNLWFSLFAAAAALVSQAGVLNVRDASSGCSPCCAKKINIPLFRRERTRIRNDDSLFASNGLFVGQFISRGFVFFFFRVLSRISRANLFRVSPPPR